MSAHHARGRGPDDRERTPARGTPRAGTAHGRSRVGASTAATLVAALSLVYAAMVLYVWVRRAGYPYELEWLEGLALEHVQRLRHGLPLYTAPSLAWVPLNYAPLYFWLSAAAAAVLGETLPALRTVSVLSTVAAGAALWRLVRVETGRAAPAWLAVGLLAATFRLGGAWFDVARADSLHLALLLGGALAARTDPSRWRMPLVAGTLFALAFLTKQSALVAAGPLVAWLAIADRRRGLALAAVAALLSAAGVVALDASSGGWFRYYAYTVPRFHAADLALLARFPLEDVARWFAPLLVAIGLAAWRARAAADLARWGFPLALAAGFVAIGWTLRVYPGGYDNVLMPAHAALALLGALAFAALTERASWRAPVALALLALQLALLAWNPAAQIPRPGDREAGDRIVAGLRGLDGRVFVSSHTYLLAHAGRPTHAHVMPLMDVIRDGEGPRERALLATLRDSLAAHAWDHALLDPRDWLAEEFVRAGYRPAANVLPDPNAFWPVTGMRTRPEVLFLSPSYVPGRR